MYTSKYLYSEKYFETLIGALIMFYTVNSTVQFSKVKKNLIRLLCSIAKDWYLITINVLYLDLYHQQK